MDDERWRLHLRQEWSNIEIVVRTRQFAVRQLRWFERDPRVRWVDVVDDPVAESAPVVAATFDA